MSGQGAGLRVRGLSLALLFLSSVAVAGSTWKLLDLGPLTVRTPAGMVLARGGTDSLAGAIVGENLRLDYDLGLYSDPLEPREGAGDFEVRAGTLDGLPARFVSYRIVNETGQTRFCTGVHVPEVRRSVMGRIGFTALACGDHPRSMKLARAILSTLLFRRDAQP